MFTLKTLVCPILLVCSLHPLPLLANSPVQLTRIEKNPDQYIASRILTDIYQRAGIPMAIKAVPSLRATQMLSEGKSDGEVARIASYVQLNPKFQLVTPAYYAINSAAFSIKPVRIKSISDLKPYKIGIIKGIQRSEELVKNLNHVERVSDFKALFLMLKSGRFDVIIDSELSSRYMAKKYGVTDIHLIGILARHDVHHILSPANKELATKISAEIETLKKSGELDKLYEKYEDEIMNSEPDKNF